MVSFLYRQTRGRVESAPVGKDSVEIPHSELGKSPDASIWKPLGRSCKWQISERVLCRDTRTPEVRESISSVWVLWYAWLLRGHGDTKQIFDDNRTQRPLAVRCSFLGPQQGTAAHLLPPPASHWSRYSFIFHQSEISLYLESCTSWPMAFLK